MTLRRPCPQVAILIASDCLCLPLLACPQVAILGTDYYKVLQEDLTEEALAWIESSDLHLRHAPHKPSAASSATAHTDDEPLDGDPVLIED